MDYANDAFRRQVGNYQQSAGSVAQGAIQGMEGVAEARQNIAQAAATAKGQVATAAVQSKMQGATTHFLKEMGVDVSTPGVVTGISKTSSFIGRKLQETGKKYAFNDSEGENMLAEYRGPFDKRPIGVRSENKLGSDADGFDDVQIAGPKDLSIDPATGRGLQDSAGEASESSDFYNDAGTKYFSGTQAEHDVHYQEDGTPKIDGQEPTSATDSTLGDAGADVEPLSGLPVSAATPAASAATDVSSAATNAATAVTDVSSAVADAASPAISTVSQAVRAGAASRPLKSAFAERDARPGMMQEAGTSTPADPAQAEFNQFENPGVDPKSLAKALENVETEPADVSYGVGRTEGSNYRLGAEQEQVAVRQPPEEFQEAEGEAGEAGGEAGGAAGDAAQAAARLPTPAVPAGPGSNAVNASDLQQSQGEEDESGGLDDIDAPDASSISGETRNITAETNTADANIANSSKALDSELGTTGKQIAEETATEGSELTESLGASLASGAGGLLSDLGGFLGDIMPFVGPIMAGYGLYSGLEGITSTGVDGDDPYKKVKAQIAAGQTQVNAMSTQISSDQFASKVGGSAPAFGSLAAPTFSTTTQMGGSTGHF